MNALFEKGQKKDGQVVTQLAQESMTYQFSLWHHKEVFSRNKCRSTDSFESKLNQGEGWTVLICQDSPSLTDWTHGLLLENTDKRNFK